MAKKAKKPAVDIDQKIETDDDLDQESYSASSGDDYDDSEDSLVDDHLVDYSVKSRESVRAALNAQIEEFLAKGGKINLIENNVTADPPRKPVSNYGSRPI